MLHIIWSIIVGFLIGLVARAIMPGAQELGFIMTTISAELRRARHDSAGDKPDEKTDDYRPDDV